MRARVLLLSLTALVASSCSEDDAGSPGAASMIDAGAHPSPGTTHDAGLLDAPGDPPGDPRGDGATGGADDAVATVDAGAVDLGAADPVDAGAPADTAGDAGASAPADSGVQPVPGEEPTGFIGGPCASDQDCAYEGGVCLLDGAGFPRGACSLRCDRLCPDREGHPQTFCVANAAPELSPGGCLSRCDPVAFPADLCRPGYRCALRARASEPETERAVCVPEGAPGTSAASDCQDELAALGVSFEPTSIPDRSPTTHPNLTCHVEDPVVLHPPIHGVDLAYYNGSPTPNVRAACSMALSLVRTVDDLRARGVTRVLHYGTYNCRVIAGTDRLSRHGHGDAIDLYGVELANGERYTLYEDWEHETTMPATPGGLFLYESAHRWFDARYWNIILTPNYNRAHDDHFHVDLTPGSHFLEFLESRYIGPAPYVD